MKTPLISMQITMLLIELILIYHITENMLFCNPKEEKDDLNPAHTSIQYIF